MVATAFSDAESVGYVTLDVVSDTWILVAYHWRLTRVIALTQRTF